MGVDVYRQRYGDAAESVTQFTKRYRKRPWQQAFENIKSRCGGRDPKSKYYKGRGIKCLITAAQLKELFFRDKAWTLKTPSVDRIDPDGNYSIENIRWIEWDDNRRRKVFSGGCRAEKFAEVLASFNSACDKFGWDDRMKRYAARKIVISYPKIVDKHRSS